MVASEVDARYDTNITLEESLEKKWCGSFIKFQITPERYHPIGSVSNQTGKMCTNKIIVQIAASTSKYDVKSDKIVEWYIYLSSQIGLQWVYTL